MTRIEWADKTWNPITGCDPVSEGCDNCYARRFASRLAGRCGYSTEEPFRVTVHTDKFAEPFKWKKPRTIFVCSMGDLFNIKNGADETRHILGIMKKCPQHKFIVLTKRPERMQIFFKQDLGLRDCTHIFWGITAENRLRFNQRIIHLVAMGASNMFACIEPMFSPVDLKMGIHNSLSWVICGGETGPRARPIHADWVRNLRDQCIEAKVPFFFKGWGASEPDKTKRRLLDGREWNEIPWGGSLA